MKVTSSSGFTDLFDYSAGPQFSEILMAPICQQWNEVRGGQEGQKGHSRSCGLSQRRQGPLMS